MDATQQYRDEYQNDLARRETLQQQADRLEQEKYERYMRELTGSQVEEAMREGMTAVDANRLAFAVRQDNRIAQAMIVDTVIKRYWRAVAKQEAEDAVVRWG